MDNILFVCTDIKEITYQSINSGPTHTQLVSLYSNLSAQYIGLSTYAYIHTKTDLHTCRGFTYTQIDT